MTLRVTVEDLEDGTRETVVVDDYLLLVARPCHLARRVAHPNGTHILTVKEASRPGYSISQTFELAAESTKDGTPDGRERSHG